jgi:hypothetical protein
MMTGFGRDRDNERFRRPQAVALKRTVPAFGILLAAGAAVAFALLLSLAATWVVDTGIGWPAI